MSTDQEIREWAAGEGIETPARGRVPNTVREAFAEAHPADELGDNLGLSVVDLDELAEPEGAEAVPEAPQTSAQRFGSGEIRPKPPAGTKLPGGLGRARGGRVVRPKKVHPRVSLEELAADGWSTMAALVGSAGLVPTSRVLEMQAPIAGMVLEDTLRGTVADRLLQPFARSQGKFKEVAALIGPPLIVTTLSLKPELSGQLLPVLRRQLRTWVLLAGPKIKAREKTEKKALAAMGLDSSEELDREIDRMVMALFAPPEQMAEHAEAMPDAA